MSKKPAIFLDRDGVLTEENSYVTSWKDLHIFSYTKDCIQKIHKKGYYAIVITNQSGIARGLFSEEQLQEMNQYLIEKTAVDAIYYCPHHPEGKIEKYRQICHCRKPKVGMFEKACREFEIDLKRSYMVGDRAGDILAGQHINLQTILVESGYGTARLEKLVKPDYIVKDLREVIALL